MADVHLILRALATATNAELTPNGRQLFRDGLSRQRIDEAFQLFQMPTSQASLTKLVNALTWPQAGSPFIRRLAEELDGRITDELGGRTLLVLSMQQARREADLQPFGDEVAKAFPSTTADIEEATKCLAFERYTACVFHLMRVMEAGVKALGARLAIDTTHKPGWEAILKKAHGQMSLPNDKKDPAWIKDESFLSDAGAMLIAVKTAWRNPTMHIEKTYTEEHAERIWESVRGFMQQLATKLHE